MNFLITQAENGLLLRNYLRFSLGLSTALLSDLKKRENGITINGNPVTVRHILSAGETLSLAVDDQEENEHILPCDMPLCVVYEDEYLLAVNKPPNCPTHPSHGHYTDTLANRICFLFRKRGIPFVFRPVNRLDRDTSGLVLVAKNRWSAGKLGDAMQKKQIKKTYLALLDGSTENSDSDSDSESESESDSDSENNSITSPIRRVSQSIILREVCLPHTPGAETAVTLWRRLASNSQSTLVCALPQTGRTHQLRVHFASIGHPILGDTLYGAPYPFIARHALHAARLSFPHPKTGEILTLSAEPPEDFLAACARAGLKIPAAFFPRKELCYHEEPKTQTPPL